MNKRYVTRSAFQKKSEECKRLKNDIYLMVMESDNSVFVKWEKHFKSEEEFIRILKEAALKYNGKKIKRII